MVREQALQLGALRIQQAYRARMQAAELERTRRVRGHFFPHNLGSDSRAAVPFSGKRSKPASSFVDIHFLLPTPSHFTDTSPSTRFPSAQRAKGEKRERDGSARRKLMLHHRTYGREGFFRLFCSLRFSGANDECTTLHISFCSLTRHPTRRISVLTVLPGWHVDALFTRDVLFRDG